MLQPLNCLLLINFDHNNEILSLDQSPAEEQAVVQTAVEQKRRHRFLHDLPDGPKDLAGPLAALPPDVDRGAEVRGPGASSKQ